LPNSINNKPIQNSPSKKEKHTSTDFLGLTMHHKKTKLEFAIYRKHTQTYIIIMNESCHPYEHKISSIYY
jgi:hypothetical protein